MNRYVAFLRAINVGGRSVKMDVLRTFFEQLGLAEVSTYIQSGNVVFESDELDTADLENKIAAKLQRELGYDVPTFIRTGPELAEIGRQWPFAEEKTADHVLYVSFLAGETTPEKAQQVVDLADGVMQFYVQGREVYWLRNKARGNSKITNAAIEKTVQLAATRRNMNTVHKIYKKFFD